MTFKHTVNLGNSIIGVSILAMPYCFKKCGIILGILLLLASSILNRAGCHLLLRSAIISKRRNISNITYSTFGSIGKLVVELCTFGYLIGTCVAFFVVVGDLGSSLISSILSISNSPPLRTFTMTFLGMFVALPLGLLRRVESLTSFSALSLSLYFFLAAKLFLDAFSKVFDSQSELEWSALNLWDTSSILITLPIFAMALSPQTQLFEIFESTFLISDNCSSIQRMNESIKSAINIGSIFYITVGIFGYIGFSDKPLKGNILLLLPPSFVSLITKLFFVLTVIVSLPLCLFPCRTSLHSLLFRKSMGSLLNENGSSTPFIYISDFHFRFLTVIIIIITIGISIIIPHIELVLGLTGSTMGSLICFIMPGLIFINLTITNNAERMIAHLVAIIGFFILFSCSYSTLHDTNHNFKSSLIINSFKAYSSHIANNLSPKFSSQVYFSLPSLPSSSLLSPLSSSALPPLSFVPMSTPKFKSFEEKKNVSTNIKEINLNESKLSEENYLSQQKKATDRFKNTQKQFKKDLVKNGMDKLNQKPKAAISLAFIQTPSLNKLNHNRSSQKLKVSKKMIKTKD